jgi:hypothetical protein
VQTLTIARAIRVNRRIIRPAISGVTFVESPDVIIWSNVDSIGFTDRGSDHLGAGRINSMSVVRLDLDAFRGFAISAVEDILGSCYG